MIDEATELDAAASPSPIGTILMIDTNALKAAARALSAPICAIERDTLASQLTDAELDALAQACITAYLNSLPVGDEGELVERLLSVTDHNGIMYDDADTIDQAADTIIRLSSELRAKS